MESKSPGGLVPLLSLRLGKLLFHAGSMGGVYDWKSRYTPGDVEAGIKTRKLSKTFDNCLRKEEYMFLHEIAHKDALHSSSKERIIIEVSHRLLNYLNSLVFVASVKFILC